MASGVVCRNLLSSLKCGKLIHAKPLQALLPLQSFHNTRLCSSQTQPTQVTDEPDQLYSQINLEVKGHDRAVLDSYTTYVKMAADELDINVAEIKKRPYIADKMTVLKSKHIFKKARVQYEMRTHYRDIYLERLTGATADTYLEYIQRNLPEGVAMTVTKHRLETIPEYLKPPEKTEGS